MHFDFMTREVWDALIIGALIVGAALAVLRLYMDFTRHDDTDGPPSRSEQSNARPTLSKRGDSAGTRTPDSEH